MGGGRGGPPGAGEGRRAAAAAAAAAVAAAGRGHNRKSRREPPGPAPCRAPPRSGSARPPPGALCAGPGPGSRGRRAHGTGAGRPRELGAEGDRRSGEPGTPGAGSCPAAWIQRRGLQTIEEVRMPSEQTSDGSRSLGM
ncbi:uncharacterized protein LOC144617102 [Panthera onca]